MLWGAGAFWRACPVSQFRNTKLVFLAGTSPFHANRGEEEGKMILPQSPARSLLPGGYGSPLQGIPFWGIMSTTQGWLNREVFIFEPGPAGDLPLRRVGQSCGLLRRATGHWVRVSDLEGLQCFLSTHVLLKASPPGP